LSNEKYRGIRINIDKNQILIKANNPEQEEAEEVLEVDYNGEPMEVGFNVSYLIEILNAIEDENIVFSLVDSSSSCLIHGNNDPKSKYVVMPMRL
ncbi:MAG: DNA polymerase III subunit beta, partial [Proteobacteria bacterium]|nr:DNA polymerase III subunit beta [Pseudomonadota bacterium]